MLKNNGFDLNLAGRKTYEGAIASKSHSAVNGDGRAVSVYLDEDSLAKAKLLGKGVVSAGIRAALQRASAE